MSDKFIPNSTALGRFNRKYVVRETGCWEWTGAKLPTGYGTFYLNNCKVVAHVASFILFKTGYVNGLDVAHACDNPRCVNPHHLVQLTHRENMIESIKKGRHPTIGRKGTQNTQAKLTEAQALEIRNANGFHHVIAAAFGVSRRTVGLIKRGVTWSHL